MGWTFRRSIGGKGPRINISTKGISVSGGVKGARIVKRLYGNKPTTVYIGGQGLRYIKTISSNKKKEPTAQASQITVSNDKEKDGRLASVAKELWSILKECDDKNNGNTKLFIDFYQISLSNISEEQYLDHKQIFFEQIGEGKKTLKACYSAVAKYEKDENNRIRNLVFLYKNYLSKLSKSFDLKESVFTNFEKRLKLYYEIRDNEEIVGNENKIGVLTKEFEKVAPKFEELNEEKRNAEKLLENELNAALANGDISDHIKSLVPISSGFVFVFLIISVLGFIGFSLLGGNQNISQGDNLSDNNLPPSTTEKINQNIASRESQTNTSENKTKVFVTLEDYMDYMKNTYPPDVLLRMRDTFPNDTESILTSACSNDDFCMYIHITTYITFLRKTAAFGNYSKVQVYIQSKQCDKINDYYSEYINKTEFALKAGVYLIYWLDQGNYSAKYPNDYNNIDNEVHNVESNHFKELDRIMREQKNNIEKCINQT